jgi:hypothetical protein
MSELSKRYRETSYSSHWFRMPASLIDLMDMVRSLITRYLERPDPNSWSSSEGPWVDWMDAARPGAQGPSSAFHECPARGSGKVAPLSDRPANMHRMTSGQQAVYDAYDQEITGRERNGEISKNVADRARVALMFEGGDSFNGPQDKSKGGLDSENYSQINYSLAAVKAFAPDRVADMAKGNYSIKDAVSVFTDALSGAEKQGLRAQDHLLDLHRGGTSLQRAGEFSGDMNAILNSYNNVQDVGRAGFRLSFDRDYLS